MPDRESRLVDRFGNRIGREATLGYEPRRYARWSTIPRDIPFFRWDDIIDMLREPVIRLGLEMRTAPIAAAEFGYRKGTDWEYGVKSDREDVKDFIERQLHHIWTFELHKFTKSQIWGWASGENVYKIARDQYGNRHLELETIKAFRSLDAHALLDKNKRRVGVQVNTSQHDGKKTEPPRLETPGKAFWHSFQTLDDEGTFEYGTSILKGAFSPFADKHFEGGALGVRRLFMHTEAFSGRRVKYPAGRTFVGEEPIPNWELALRMVEQYRSGDVVTMSSERDENGNPLWEMEESRATAVPTHILDYPKDLDKEMLRGILIPEDVLTSEGMTGAWAGKRIPMQAFVSALQRWANEILATVLRDIIEPLIWWNWGREIDYEVGIVPLAYQAMKMEQQSMQPQQQPPGGSPFGDVSGGFSGNAPQPDSPFSLSLGRDIIRRAAYDPELEVGRGKMRAASLVRETKKRARKNRRTMSLARKHGRRRRKVET